MHEKGIGEKVNARAFMVIAHLANKKGRNLITRPTSSHLEETDKPGDEVQNSYATSFRSDAIGVPMQRVSTRFAQAKRIE